MAQIRVEISNGHYVICGAPLTLVSSLGAVKKPESGRIRLIHDCSRPQGVHSMTLQTQTGSHIRGCRMPHNCCSLVILWRRSTSQMHTGVYAFIQTSFILQDSDGSLQGAKVRPPCTTQGSPLPLGPGEHLACSISSLRRSFG